jgi:septum site-determining protein MinD
MSKIISVHSYRGGTGKSNTTANLASIIARDGNRVGIVDTDIQSPGIHVLFGFSENNMDRCLNDYLWGRCPISDAAYDVSDLLPKLRGKGNLYLIPSSIKAGEIARVLREGYDVGLLTDGFQELMDVLKLDYLFIDTHPGLNEETLLSITISDILLLILRPDQQDFQGTAVTVDVARKLEVPKILMTINKAPESLDFDDLKQQVENVYGISVAGVLPHSDKMMLLASKGVFALNFPKDPLTAVVEGIAKMIVGP